MVQLKTPAEIVSMQKAGRVVALVFEAMAGMVRHGVSTYELDRIAEQVIRAEGATPSFLHYGNPPFPASICVSLNEEVVHGIPSRQRLIQNGDLVSIDVGAMLDGFHGDAARTYAVGDVSPEKAELMKVTEECFWIGFELARVGNRIGDISSAISEHAESHGYGVVRELTGHGIGRRLHESPDVPNYGRKGHGMRIEAGLVIAIEPMINLGREDIRIKEDNWTCVTKDGKPSSHYENTIAVTADGPVITTQVPL
jgi:methionyl aminopeptidase